MTNISDTERAKISSCTYEQQVLTMSFSEKMYRDIVSTDTTPSNNAFSPHVGLSPTLPSILPSTKYLVDDIKTIKVEENIEGNVEEVLIERENVYTFNNAVMKLPKMDNSGNSSTFIDGGTKKEVNNIFLPNLCLCINEGEDKLYIVVSYTIEDSKINNENMRSHIIMRINFIYYKSETSNWSFVVHEFLLGKGAKCAVVYECIGNSINQGRHNPNGVDPNFYVLLFLKKTCCDLFQNIFKTNRHTQSINKVGFFKKMKSSDIDLFHGSIIRENGLDLTKDVDIKSKLTYNANYINEEIDDTTIFNYTTILWDIYHPKYGQKNYRYFNTISGNQQSQYPTDGRNIYISVTGDILDWLLSSFICFLNVKNPESNMDGGKIRKYSCKNNYKKYKKTKKNKKTKSGKKYKKTKKQKVGKNIKKQQTTRKLRYKNNKIIIL